MAAGLLLLAVGCVGLGSLSYALALACKDKDWMFWLVQQTLLFPLLLLAGMLLPIDNGPDWLQALSRANPLRCVVDAERAIFNGDFSGGIVLGGALAAVLMAAFGLWVGPGRCVPPTEPTCTRGHSTQAAHSSGPVVHTPPAARGQRKPAQRHTETSAVMMSRSDGRLRSTGAGPTGAANDWKE